VRRRSSDLAFNNTMSRQRDNSTARRHLFGPANVILVCAVGLALLGLTVLFSASASFRTDP
jgi:hypothetical protein